MKQWMLGALLGAAAGSSVYLATVWREAPTPPIPPEAPAVAAATPAPPAPVVLAEVIDVTDIDPLLDPPPEPTEPVAADRADTFPDWPVEDWPVRPDAPAIPLATDADPPAVEVAPMPREVVAADPASRLAPRPTPADAARRQWYGTDRLPQQIGAGLIQDQLWQEIWYHHEQRRPRIGGPGVGITMFF
jgi:hypothetical protein